MVFYKKAFVFICYLLVMNSVYGDDGSLDELVKIQKEQALPMWQFARHQAIQQQTVSDPLITDVWQRLDTWAKANPNQAPLSIVTNPKNETELVANLNWLRRQILVNNADGRYSYAYAYLLLLVSQQDKSYQEEALIFFAHARLSLAIDELRCVNKKDVGYLQEQIESQGNMVVLKKALEALTLQQQNMLTLNAQTIELMRGERQPMTWLCLNKIKSKQFIETDIWRKERTKLMDSILQQAAKNNF